MKKAIVIISFLAVVANAQWLPSGTPVCDTSANAGIEPLSRIAPDGVKGAIICWRDIRNGTYDIYAQHVDSMGKSLWQRNGIPIVVAANNQDFPRIISDRRNGAFIAWEDSRSNSNTFVYAQRVDQTGNALWQQNGIKVADAGGLYISIANDDSDGLVVAWNFLDGVSRDDVAVQRLNGFGNRMWGDSGVVLTNRPTSVSSNDVGVVADGTGGAIVAWIEGGSSYAQHVDNSGKTCWISNGVQLSDTSKSAFGVAICSDTHGGAIVNWNYADGSGSVQKIDHEGRVLWGQWGVTLPVSGSGGERRNTPDGRAGAFIGDGLYIQHFDSLGEKIWGENGTAYFDTLGTTNSSQLSDGNQGVFNFTEADNISKGTGGIAFVLAQWIDGSGKIRFGMRGIKVTSGLDTGYQFWPAAVDDGSGGAIVSWDDFRNGYAAIYAALVDTSGVVTNVHQQRMSAPSSFQLKQNYPNPFNPETTIEYFLPKRELAILKIFDSLGREVTTLMNQEQSPGIKTIIWKGVDSKGQRVASGIYFYQLITPDQKDTKKAIYLK